jgi:hypothetical protein
MAPDRHLIGTTAVSRQRKLNFPTDSMTSPWTHEINRTVAALAAETRQLYPTVAGKPGVELQPQRASRTQLPNAKSMCYTSIRPMYRTHKSDGVLAVRHATGYKGRQMVWLEVRNERAVVMVDKAQYNDWKEKHSVRDVERNQHGLQRDVS